MDKYTKIKIIGLIVGLVIFVGLLTPIVTYNTPVENPIDTTSVDTIEVDSIK